MISFLKRRKAFVIAALLLVGVLIVGFNVRAKNGYETLVVSRGDIVRTVELAGKVIPEEDVDLSFEVGGTVSSVYKKVGDKVRAGTVIVELDMTAMNADLLKAQADLSGARAELAKLEGGSTLQAKVSNTKASVVQDIFDAYTDADDAIYNKVDQFFEEPRDEIIFAFDDYALKQKIDQNRYIVDEILEKWKSRLVFLSSATYTQKDLEDAKSYIKTISAFLDDVSRAVNDFDVNSSLTQSMIDGYRADTASARQNVNAAAAALLSGEESFVSTSAEVPVQVARVLSAEATVANYQSKLGKMALRSPIDGVVSRQDAKAGEAISPNTNAVSIISEDYKMEAYVPEVSIGGVHIGATAKVTLDAYGDDVVFDARITHIDPRETIRDGVSTYKIDLELETPDPRILSGMTSNISIETYRKAEAVVVPLRAVLSRDGEQYVLVKTNDGREEREISLGQKDSKGNVEIASGLSEGEIILLNPVK